MLDPGSVVEPHPTDPADGDVTMDEEPGSATSLNDPISVLPSSEATALPIPHNAHAEMSSNVGFREPRMFEHSLNELSHNIKSVHPNTTDSTLESLHQRVASIGQDTSISPLVKRGQPSSNDHTPEQKMTNDLSSLVDSYRRTISNASGADVSSDSYKSVVSGNARPTCFGVPKIRSVGFDISPEEALKMLSECDGGSARSSRSCTTDGRDVSPANNTFTRPQNDSARHPSKERMNLDDELLGFLRSQTIQSMNMPRTPCTDDSPPTESGAGHRPPNGAAKSSNNTDTASASQCKTDSSGFRPIPDYSAYFKEDSETFSQLRALFTKRTTTHSDSGEVTPPPSTLPTDDADFGLQPVSPILEWLPEEPTQSEQPPESNVNVSELFTESNIYTPYDMYGEPYFASDHPDNKGDVNAKVRLLRQVHESLYTTSDVASLGTIEKFMLELLQPASDFGNLSAYGRLLAFINLSALRRHMSQLSALYCHPEMAVVRHVMRYNEEGAIKKALHISESVANGQMNDKAGYAAIAELIARLDRKLPIDPEKGSYDNILNVDSPSGSGYSQGGRPRSIKCNRQLLTMLDDLSALYRSGGEAHFPRFVCGTIDRRHVTHDETLSVPFDKGDRRTIHVQFERMDNLPTTSWPTTTNIPHTLTEGLRVQVLPTKQHTSMYWTVGTIKSVSSGVLMVATDSQAVKEPSRSAPTDRMYMMRNFVPPNVPLTRLEKAQWRMLPREFEPERDLYIGSCLSVYDATIGGYVDRVVVNIIYGDAGCCCVAPVKPPNDETLFETSLIPLDSSREVKNSDSSTSDSMTSTGLSLTNCQVTNTVGVLPDTDSAASEDIAPENEELITDGFTNGVPTGHNASTDHGHTMAAATEQTSITNLDISVSPRELDDMAIRIDVSPLIPTCQCNGHTLRVFEGRSSTFGSVGTLQPKRVVLTSLYDRTDVTLDIVSLRAYKLNYDLQSHFDCAATASPSGTNSHTMQFQHCVWVVPRHLPFTDIRTDALPKAKIGSKWFFEPERCLMIFPYNKGVDILQEIPRLVSFLHPELNFMALCAGIWSVRAAGRSIGESHQVTNDSTSGVDGSSSRPEVVSLTRSQKAATRELTFDDIVNEACIGVTRCSISIVRRLFGCTSVISLWMILDGVDVDNLESSEPTLRIHIPEKPNCTTCGGAVYARDGVMKALPADSPVILPTTNLVPRAGDSDRITNVSAPPPMNLLSSEITSDSGAYAESLMDACMNSLSNAGMNIQELRNGAQTKGLIDPMANIINSKPAQSCAPGAANIQGHAESATHTRAMPIFNDLESTEEVIQLLQGLSTCRWRLTREFSASCNGDDDVAAAASRVQHHPLGSTVPRNCSGKSEFIAKLAQFLSSTRRARDTRIDVDLYRDAYSTSSEHFNPRSIEAVLLRGWGAFLMGQHTRASQQAQRDIPNAASGGHSMKPSGATDSTGGLGSSFKPGFGGYRGDLHSFCDIFNEHDPLSGPLMSHLLDDDLDSDPAPGGPTKRKPRDDKRPRNSRVEPTSNVRSGSSDQRRSSVEQPKKPRKPSKSLLARLAESEYCEFKDKEVRYKFVSVVKWDEDLEPSALVTGAQ
ncbi:hypothetical protein BaOVIS_012220 [Babesia ovis]|uniref:Uncharacterized protein n=1 Tax=Babesia ovis TaxID=5869 RepID=A0A9W5WUE3_BABOV|nr:hypothetical protein BaOVIS_012220 [Babesia ovis]